MESKYVNRYDVTILINGLSMVQIELKSRGKDFNQIERYRRHSFKGLYRYSDYIISKFIKNTMSQVKKLKEVK